MKHARTRSRLASIGVAATMLVACGQADDPASPSLAPSSITASESASVSSTPVPSASAQAAPSQPDPRLGSTLLLVQADGVRMRAEPSSEAEIRASLPAGVLVRRTAADPVEADDLTWYEVQAADASGWVASGPAGDWLVVVTNGRIGFACETCGDQGSRAFASVQPDGSDLEVLDVYGAATWSRDGTRVVVSVIAESDAYPDLTLIDDGGERREPLGPGSEPAWSPDGEWLAFSNAEAGTLVLIDSEGTRFDLTVNDHAAPGSLAWSPDSSQLAFTAIDCAACPVGEPLMGDIPHGIYLFTPPTGSVDLLVPQGFYGAVQWAPDGQSLTYHATDLSSVAEMRRVDVASGAVTTILDDAGFLAAVAVSPDASHLVVQNDDGIVVGNADGSDLEVLVPRSEDADPSPMHPRWSPDGDWILYDMVYVHSSGATEAWIVPADGSGEPRLVAEDATWASWQPLLVPVAP